MLAPVTAVLVGRLFYRHEITAFTLGVSGLPVIGPAIGAIGFGISALVYFHSLRNSDHVSDGTVIGFLVSVFGLVALSGLAAWQVRGWFA